MPKASKQRPSSKKRRWVWGAIKWIIFGILGILGLAAAVVSWYATDLPSIRSFDHPHKKPSIIFLTKDHREIGTRGHLYGETVTLKQIPKDLIHALIATEDRRFFEHKGVDIQGLFRAFVKNILSGHVVQGGSTLTQQLVKNTFLTHERSLSRKIQELILAVWLEHHFSKKQILTIYLNRVYLGGGTFGVDAAAQLYFGKLVSHLTLPESAVIAGLLKAPNRYAKKHNQLKARAQVVLHNMLEMQFITEKQYKNAVRAVKHMTFRNQPIPSYRYFTDWVATELEGLVDTSQDLIVITTLDAHMQNVAIESIKSFVQQHRKPSHVQQAAFVALSLDGAVRALVGGTHYTTMQYNLATQSKRQMGSAFKPVVYLAALEKGYELTDILEDKPYKRGSWEVNNFGWQERGSVTLQEGLTYSINTATVRLAEKIGVNSIIQMAEKLGLPKPRRDLSIALGTMETSLLRLVNAFAIIGNQGISVKPYGILEIRNGKGKILYKRPPFVVKEVMDPLLPQKLLPVLEAVVNYGTGKAAQIPGKIIKGKTGTTQRFRDALFIGLVDHLVAGVWMGNPDDTPMKHVSGGTLPAQLWKKIMEKVLPPSTLLSPENVVS